MVYDLLLSHLRNGGCLLPHYQTSANERAKNRVHVRRLYYKKLNSLGDLHRRVRNLESEYERVLATYQQQDARPTPLNVSTESEMVKLQDTKAALYSAHIQLAQIRRTLTNENIFLKHRCAEYVLMERAIARLTDAQSKAVEVRKREKPAVNGNCLTPEQCFNIAMASYSEVNAFREAKTTFSTGVSVFGWQDWHAANQENLMFSLHKVFRGQAVEKMAGDMWAVLSQPKHIDIMSPRDATMSYYVVQRVGGNAVLYYYILERPTNDLRERAFILVMRLDLEPGRCLMILRTLDPKTYFPEFTRSARGRKKIEPQKESVWLDLFLWSMYESVGDNREDCKEEC